MRVIAACIVSTLLATSAIAQTDEQQAARLHEEGVRLYNLAQYDKAIEVFQRAYLLSGHSGLLFNIAQAYRQENRCSEALTFYRNYLRAQPDAPARELVDRRISEMEACANATALQPPVGATLVAPTPSTVATQGPVAPPAAVQQSSTRPWMWALGAGGLAFAAGGTALLVSTHSGLDACSPRCSPSRIDDLRLRAGIGYGLLAGAALSVGAATWLWWRAPGRDSEQAQLGVSFAPSSVSVWSTF
jgi:tetratricopeptide (TPR) repeat protein